MALDSEERFLALIDRHFPTAHPDLALGRGDDCAVLLCPDKVCLSTDLLIEGVHFRRSYFRPEDIGHKALAANLSDLAAMGASPMGFALELMVPEGLGQRFWDRLLSGMAALAREFDLPLAGGDLSRSPVLGLGLTIWGRAAPNGRFLARGGCCPGDALFVCGDLGLAKSGLLALERSGRRAVSRWPAAAAALLRPKPLIAHGLALAACETVRGLMDLSDGLAADLPRFLGPELGADLDIKPADLNQEVLDFARKNGLSPLDLAISGGDDYALLGAAPAEGLRLVRARVPELTPIGRVSRKPGLRLAGKPIRTRGFDHFKT
ncbi:MAG: thiamine-phosphate kinase [Desulfovibrionaceae bacterium]|nr:thiamine-phosphate kinase [Desulfovibrionaceae bacterium]